MVIGSDQDGSSETPSSTLPNGARAVQSPPSALASSDRKPPLRVSDRISEAVPARPTMPQRASLNEVDQRSLVRIENGRLALMLSSFSGERCPALYGRRVPWNYDPDDVSQAVETGCIADGKQDGFFPASIEVHKLQTTTHTHTVHHLLFT